MEVFSRLAIGTASWNPAGYGHRNVHCPIEQQREIISYCMSAGIHTLDTAVAYNVDLSWVPTAFDIVMKYREGDTIPEHPAEPVWAHSPAAYDWLWKTYKVSCYGVSLYDPADFFEATVPAIQIPYSPFDRRWEEYLSEIHDDKTQIYVRSCFCQGKVFTSEEPVFVRFRKYAAKLGLPVGTLCILFCLLNPNVDKVILGVDSVEQLREDLRFFHRLNGFQVDDLNVIDPRRWEKK